LLHRIFAVAAALSLAVAALAVPAAPASAATLTIRGTVTDSRDGSAMPNVCITVGVPGQYCWTITNVAGQYFIDLGTLGAQSGSSWTIYFIRDGFDTKSQTIVVDGEETLNMVMTPTPGVTPPATVPPRTNVLNPAPPVTGLPTYTVYLPNITKTLGGANGWHTPFIVQNVGTATGYLDVQFYDFTTGALKATRTATVQPGRSFVDSPRDEADLPGDSQFSVVVTSSGSPIVAVVNEHQGPGAGNEALSYSGASAGANTVYLPLVSNMVSGWLTTMIMQNVGTTTTTVTASFISLDGTKTATVTRTILPGRSAFIDPRVESSLVAGTEYAAKLTAAQPIAVVANDHNDLPGTVAPRGDSYNAVNVGAGVTTYLPYIAKNTDSVGRTSRIVVQNAGTTTATPTISLVPFTGPATSTGVTAPAIAPGASWAFTPTVADGEYSATITGGSFAALVLTETATTSMHYAGTSTPANKLFMPNITRVLTQDATTDPGWNTPILLHSATATNGTLKWYSFSTGALVLSQSITLVQNQTLRVDPKAVTGLTNNSQYAVVFESTSGTAVALVTELNLIGGDTAMIYKAFLQP
jgi:hypothetical protein